MPDPPPHASPQPQPRLSATALLADPVSRRIVVALGEARGQRLPTTEIIDRAILGATPRLIRDRMRQLERHELIAADDGRAPLRTWALTSGGQDLHRLQALMGRIAANAAGLPTSAAAPLRDAAVGRALAALADPVVLQIARALAEGGSLDPVALEARCAPTPRRTVYRRLSELVECGSVIRTTSRTVPRSTRYDLTPRWRPAAAILLLSGWWQARHVAPLGQIDAFDLEGLLLSVLPAVRPGGVPDGQQLRWIVTGPGAPAQTVLAVTGRRLAILQASAVSSTEDQTRVVGTPAEWSSALVTDRREGLSVTGDARAATEVLTAVRTSLLTYMR